MKFATIWDNRFIVDNLKDIPDYFLQPLHFFKTYDRANLKDDFLSGLTVAVVLLPQAIAFALIAELPPQMGLYTAIIGGIIGGIWGSSDSVHTGPTNALSLLVLSALLATSTPGTADFIIAAGLIAVMAGLFQLAMGLARLGMLVNFVSHSVVVGFSTGAAILIGVGQIRRLLGLQFASNTLVETLVGLVTNLPSTHLTTALLGIGIIILIIVLRKINPKIPGPLVAMIVASAVVFFLALDNRGVEVIGQLPSSLPPLVNLPLLDLGFIARLSTGALAVGAIGLVQTIAIARAFAAQTGQRLNSNQEFVGQGLANIACGFFSGYACSGSFSSSAVRFKAGAKTAFSSIFSSIFVLVAMFILAPLAAYLPRAALAGVLIVIAYGMIDWVEIRRIWRGARGDALIMLVTLLGTLFLAIEFAVLVGILLSFAYYIMKTSVPRVYPVLPDSTFKHFVQPQPGQQACPQLGIIKISGDLYFGAVNHVEEALLEHLEKNPEQRFLLLRMHGVNQCDFSGIHMLEAIQRACRERGGDIFFMKTQTPVLKLMKSTGFYDQIGSNRFLNEEQAIGHLFYHIIDPAICIYECQIRAFKECQNLPKQTQSLDIPFHTSIPADDIDEIKAEALYKALRNPNPPLVIDVREPREYRQGHVPQARLTPLPKILSDISTIPQDRPIVLVCSSGRRSMRAAQILRDKGYQEISVLHGGILAWEATGLLEAVEQPQFL